VFVSSVTAGRNCVGRRNSGMCARRVSRISERADGAAATTRTGLQIDAGWTGALAA
jgi:hypothetical protein